MLLSTKMTLDKRRMNRENLVDTTILLDTVTSLIDAFKQAGYNPPTSIRVDKQAFTELLEEASKLYSSINVKDSIINNEFSLVNIIKIICEEKEEEVDSQQEQHHFPQEQKDIPEVLETKEGNHEKQEPTFTTIATKYECPDCGATFDTPAGHRKHYQAFHDKIEEPKVIEQAEI
jgi:hypothetical protein